MRQWYTKAEKYNSKFNTEIALQSLAMDKDPQCISKEPKLKLRVRTPFMARCTWYNIMWNILSVTCDRSVVISGSSDFLSWPPWYSWNIVEISLHSVHLKSRPPSVLHFLCTWKMQANCSSQMKYSYLALEFFSDYHIYLN
jgi:hypothetical protein